jgi:superoxide dismutase, Fe-Mn family
MFVLNPLPYSYDSLQPHIGADTLQIHHGKHHQAYVNKLNEILAEHTELLELPIDVLLKHIHSVPENIKQAVINNAGQVYNHNLYWESMGPNAGGQPTGQLAQKIDSVFGSFQNFKEQFNNLGVTQFGSGWVWLCVDDSGNLSIEKTANADSPLMHGKNPIMTMDVWEHAYYLNYQNRRPDYINAFWNVVNWVEIERKYTEALK